MSFQTDRERFEKDKNPWKVGDLFIVKIGEDCLQNDATIVLGGQRYWADLEGDLAVFKVEKIVQDGIERLTSRGFSLASETCERIMHAETENRSM